MKSSRRRGKFIIPLDVIMDNPTLVKNIMNECIIFRAEMLYVSNGIEYVAESDLFDLVPSNKITPEYDVYFTKNRWMFFPTEYDKLMQFKQI